MSLTARGNPFCLPALKKLGCETSPGGPSSSQSPLPLGAAWFEPGYATLRFLTLRNR